MSFGGFTHIPNGELGVSLTASKSPMYSEVRQIKLCELCGISFTRLQPLGMQLGQKYCQRCDARLTKPVETVPQETPEDIKAAQHSDHSKAGAYKRWARYRANKALSPRTAVEPRSGA